MACNTCPEGYVCSVERAVSWTEMLAVFGGAILVGLVLSLVVIGVLSFIDSVRS